MGDEYDRQGFLGPDLDRVLEHATIGVVGLSGGGSHIVQQLAHIGFQNYAIFDPDVIEESNLTRLVGARWVDVVEQRPKVEIAKRVILDVRPRAHVVAVQARWQVQPADLRGCDIVFGCVDTFVGRRDMEALTRRFLIPYIDIGMDVHCLPAEPPRVAGQVILSMPGAPCMRCFDFLNDQNLGLEAARYGDTGPHQQVVWANGVLASTAIGLAIDLLTGWSGASSGSSFLSYDGNTGTVVPAPKLEYLKPGTCAHFPISAVGLPRGQRL